MSIVSSSEECQRKIGVANGNEDKLGFLDIKNLVFFPLCLIVAKFRLAQFKEIVILRSPTSRSPAYPLDHVRSVCWKPSKL